MMDHVVPQMRASGADYVAFTCDSGGNHNVRAWNLDTGRNVASYNGGSTHGHTLAFIRDDYIISAHKEKPQFGLWSFQQYKQVNRKFAAPAQVRALAVTPDGSLCFAGIERDIFVWDVRSGELQVILRAHCQNVTTLRLSPDGELLASASLDSTLALWSVQDIVEGAVMGGVAVQPYRVITEHTHAVSDVSLWHAKLVASVSVAGLLTVHSATSGQLQFVKNFGQALDAVLLDSGADALTVFVAQRDGRIVRLSLGGCGANGSEQQQQQLVEFVGHTGRVTSLAMSALRPDLLLSGSEDATARLWDAHSGHALRTLRHDGPVTDVRIAPLPASAHQRDPEAIKALPEVRNFARMESEVPMQSLRWFAQRQADSPSEQAKQSCQAWRYGGMASGGSAAVAPLETAEERVSMAQLAVANDAIVRAAMAFDF